MSTSSRAVPALAAALAVTLLAIVAAAFLQWLMSQSVLLASGVAAAGMTASVVLPIYVYALVRIARTLLREREREAIAQA